MNQLVKAQYSDIYKELALNLHNPYDYYQDNEYYCLVHSSIDYVFKK